MTRYIVAAVLMLHGLIHAMGFLVAFRLAALPLTHLTPIWMSASWTRPVGMLWLLACVGFAVSATLLLLQHNQWWLPGSLAVVLSQGLIMLAWQDAKAGTVANVLLILPLVVGAAHSRFERDTRRALDELRTGLPTAASAPILREEIERLPQPVTRWLSAAGVVGRARPHSVWLRQTARLRTEPGGAWMPCDAEQNFRIDQPGFVWKVRTRMLGVVPIDGRDSYLHGRGRMLIKPLSFLTVVDAADSHVDQGTLLRYLGELVWFPSAALEPYIQWSAIDANTARATMSYAGTTASASFEIAADGRVMRVSAERYMGSGAEAKLRPWTIPFRAWKALDGVVIPVEGEVMWQLESGPFAYYDFVLQALRYDPGSAEIPRPNLSVAALVP